MVEHSFLELSKAVLLLEGVGDLFSKSCLEEAEGEYFAGGQEFGEHVLRNAYLVILGLEIAELQQLFGDGDLGSMVDSKKVEEGDKPPEIQPVVSLEHQIDEPKLLDSVYLQQPVVGQDRTDQIVKAD